MSIKYNDKTNNREILLAGISPVDQILNGTSKNAIANKAVYNALKEKIEKTVSDLVNYYSKADVYNKAEVRALISTISTMDIQVVNALPTEDISTTTIYFLKPAGATTYDEYVYINNAWVKIGTTDLDLSQYVTNDALTLRLADYYTKDEITTLLTDYAQKDNVYDKDAVDALLDDKQDTLTFDNAPTEDSVNVVKSGGVYSAVDDVYKVMGKNGAKNLISYPPYRNTHLAHRGITFDVNEDGSVNFEGTATDPNPALMGIIEGTIILPAGSYTLSGGTNLYGGVDVYFFDNSECTEDYSGTYTGLVLNNNYVHISTVQNGQYFAANNFYGYEKTFTINQPAYLRVQARSVNTSYASEVSGTIYPMLRLASDTDNAWQPYAKTNQQLTKDKAEQAEINDIVNVYGTKNLLQYPYYSTTTTVSGVTITDNGDGTLTLDGTATARISYNITATASYNLLEVGKKYLINFKTSNDTIDSSSWALRIYCKKDSTTVLSTTDSRGPDVAFTVPEETVGANVQFIIVNGTVLDSVVIKPMIRLASITDDTYVPYAKTNQQLTEDKAEKSQVSNPNLLDNPWFTINQRGITDSWNTQFSVGVDRWAKSSDSSSTLEVTTDGIAEVDGKAFSIYQVLDSAATNYESIKRLYGKTLTISVLFSDGIIETGSYNLPLSDYRPSTNQTRTFINNSTRIEYARIESFAVGNVNLAIRVKAGNVIRAVKLEIGTASTLINDTAPNYQQELAKCQRYFVRFKSNATYSVYSGMGYVVSATEVRTPMNLPVSMRQSPTVTTSGSFRIFNATDYSTMSQSITSVSGMGFLGSKLMLKCVGTGFISGKMAMLAADNDADTYIDFSADL